MVVSLIGLALVVIVLILAATAISASRGNSKEGGNIMMKNVYIYVVLFATLMMIIGGSVSAFMAIADIVTPAPYHQSFEEYRQWGLEKSENANTKANLSEAELRARYDALIVAEKDRQVNRAKNRLVKSMGWIIIPLPVFIVFQRRLKSSPEV
ncbi:hypothetical protein [Syntrophomonas wolfei]|mgnify:FL=1|uniref:hypothetical protein n=1 Tax=Syntrophomonas wolfei TaxID=863 RepID=UPI0007748E59|nr:hypothetical protein [Syntrophomonas wolfei]